MNAFDFFVNDDEFASYLGQNFNVAKRSSWILPKVISLNMQPLGEAKNGAKPYFNEADNLNWTHIYGLDDTQTKFNHEFEIKAIMKLYFGTQDEVQDMLCQTLGYQILKDRVVLAKVLNNRRRIFINGGYDKPKNMFNVGIYYCEKQAHKPLKTIIDELDKATAYIVNGDQTFVNRYGKKLKMTNANCEDAIKKKVADWIQDTKTKNKERYGEDELKEDDRLIILADDMASRSLSVPEIMFTFITGNSIGINPFAQKSKRPGTLGDFKDKDTVVYDCSMSLTGYSFNGFKQVEEFARKHGKKIKDVLGDQKHDPNHLFCPYYIADFFSEMGDCVTPWSEQAYLEYEKHFSLEQATSMLVEDASKADGFNELDVEVKKVNNKNTSPKQNQTPGSDVVPNGDEPSKSNGATGQEKSSKVQNELAKEKNKRLEIVKSLVDELLRYEYLMYAYPVEGEDSKYPFADRDKVYRKKWIECRWHKYMGDDKKGSQETNKQRFEKVWDWFVNTFKDSSLFNLKLKSLSEVRELRKANRTNDMFDFMTSSMFDIIK